MIDIKEAGYKFLLIIIGLFIGIAILEICAGIYLTKTKSGWKIEYIQYRLNRCGIAEVGVYDKEIGWGLKKHKIAREVTSEFDVIYSINSSGLRDREIPLKKPAGEFRIILLGESNVFGWGVNYGERFSEVVEKKLANVEVINMGIGGFGIDQSFLQLQRDGFKFNPDLVILFVYDEFLYRSMDFIRDFGAFKPRFVFDRNKARIEFQDLDFIKNKFGRQSSFFGVDRRMHKGIFTNSKLFILCSYLVNIRKIENPVDVDKKRRIILSTKLSLLNKYRHEYSHEDFKTVVFYLLKKYKDLCSGHQVKFLIVKIGEIDFFDAYLKTLTIPSLDLTNRINEAEKNSAIKFEADRHFNAFGHAVIGEYLSDYLAGNYHLRDKTDSYTR